MFRGEGASIWPIWLLRLAALLMAAMAVVSLVIGGAAAASVARPASGSAARFEAVALAVGGWTAATGLLAAAMTIGRLAWVIEEHRQAALFLRDGISPADRPRLALL